MKKQHSAVIMAGCFLAGTLVGIPAVHAAAEYLTATRSTQPVYLNGQEAKLEACNVENTLYVRLRDVCQLLDVNVYWDGANVQIETDQPYTGEVPTPAPAASAQPVPITSQPAQDGEPATDDVDALRQEIVDRTNAVRVAHGVKVLPTDPMLMKAAQVRAVLGSP